MFGEDDEELRAAFQVEMHETGLSAAEYIEMILESLREEGRIERGIHPVTGEKWNWLTGQKPTWAKPN